MRNWERAIGVGLTLVLLVGAGACAGPAAPPASQAAAASQPAASAAGAAAPGAAPAAPQHLKVSWSGPGSGYLPLFAAQERGFFTARNLTVEPVLTGGAQAVSALLANELDVAYPDGAALVRAALAGGDIVLLATTFNVFPFKVIANPALRQPQDLRGKRIGITRAGSTSDFAARYFLPRVGLKPDEDVALIQIGSGPDLFSALTAGGIDAGMFGQPDGYRPTQEGYVSLYDLTSSGIEYPTAPLGVLRSTVAAQPEALRGLIAGLTEGIAWVKQNRAEALAVLARYTKIDDEGALAATYDDHVPYFPRAPYPTEASIQTILDSIRDMEPGAATARPSDFVDDRFVRELDQSGYIARLYP